MGIFHERAIVTESGTTIGLRSRALLWPLCLVVVLGMFSNSLKAATFTVDSTTDAVDASPGNGVCATSGAVCTLRAAIQESNALAGADSLAELTGADVAASTDTPDNCRCSPKAVLCRSTGSVEPAVRVSGVKTILAPALLVAHPGPLALAAESDREISVTQLTSVFMERADPSDPAREQ